MSFFEKKGVSLVSVLIIVVIVAILASITTISINTIINDTYKKEFISEYYLVKSATEDYVMRNSGVIDFTEIEFNMSSVGVNEIEQFEGETIVDNRINMYIIDLEKIGVYNTTYGTGEDENDVYLISKDTNNVYYKKGFNDKGTLYYKGIND